MEREIKDRKTAAAGWAVSLVLHALLLLLFLNVMLNRELEETDFVQVSFTSYVPAERQNLIRSQPQAPVQRQQTVQQSQQTRVVDLPERRMIENEPPKLLSDVRDKVAVENQASRTGEKADPVTGVSRQTALKPGARTVGDKELPGSRISDVGEKVTTNIPTEGLGGDQISKRPYEIEWEGGDREVLSAPLPAFPDGVNRSFVVKFRINAMPDGSMGDIRPLQKGDAALENVTVDALKKWRFNPLEKTAPQVPQIGVITFRFILK